MKRHERPLPRTNPSGRKVWVARYTDRHGKRRSAGTFDLRRDAQEAIWRAYERDGAGPGDRARTLGEYAERWTIQHPRSERTNENHISRLRAVLDVPVSGTPLRDWPMHEVERWHGTVLVDVMLRKQGRAASGARAVLSTLSAMYEDAVGDGVAKVNPFLGLRVRAADPRVQKPPRPVTIASWEDMHRFAAACGVYEPMVRVLSDCGLRLGELLPLERGDWHGDSLEVRRTAWKGRVMQGTKTDHGQADAGRVVPVPPGLRDLLSAMPKRIDTRLLFPGRKGGVWHERRFYEHVWYPAQKATGLLIRPHDMRHSYVSLMRAARVDPADLAEATGHTVETATGKYTHSIGTTFDAMRAAIPS
jgi:integrase